MSAIETADILLVEDRESDAELALRVWTRERLSERVRVARDGPEALEYLSACAEANGLPRVVVLDLKLPRMHGLEVLRRIREDMRTVYLPVVVLSSSSEEADIAGSYQAGANSYVVKPVIYDRFAEIVREVGHYWLCVNRLPRPEWARGQR